MAGYIARPQSDFSTPFNLSNHSLVVIDSQVDDLAALLSDVSDAGQVIILNSQQDGVAQITAALEASPALTALHLISHGEQGCLHLGSSQLSFASLDQYETQLRAWAKSLQGRELLLYGCNVAQGALGHLFIQQLHQLTGASIAASPLAVGRTEQGAQWELTHQVGAIQSPIAFSQALQQVYVGQFAAPVFSGTAFPSYSTPVDELLSIPATTGVLNGVTDADNDVLRIDLADVPSNGGNIVLNPEDGSFNYRPAPGFVGIETFSYTVTDGTSRTESIPVTIKVGNQNPVFPSSTPSYAVDPNGRLVVSAADGVLNGVSDPDGDSLQVFLSQNPTNGNILISPTDGSFTYVPNAGFVGTETFFYTVSDGVFNSAPIPVTVNVGNPTNAAPVIPTTSPSYGVATDGRLTVTSADGVLNGVIDPDGDTLRIALADNPQNGDINISAEDGSFLYVPNPGFSGTETFTYTVTDGTNTSAPIPVTINVSRPPVVPATDPSYTTPSGTSLTVAPTDGVLDGVTDPDGDPLRIALVDIPQNGDINISPEDGSFLYVPNPGFSGTETFTYTVTDGINTSEPIPVTIAVTAPTTGGNQPPTLPDATPTYGAPANQPFVVSPTEGVLQGVTDPEGDPLRIDLVDVPQNGDINISPEDGSFTYVPTPGFAGPETFTYTVTDGTNTSAPIPVSINVSRPPVVPATDPSYTTPSGTSLTVAPTDGVLDGVTDPDGDPLRIALVDIPQNGDINISPEDGSFLYVPNPGFSGTETFTYTVTDGINTSEPIPVTIAVTAPTTGGNQPPTLPDATPTYGAPANQPFVVSPTEGVLQGVTDPEGDPLRIDLVDVPQNGDINISPEDGSFTYVPNAGFAGPETFTYMVTDGTNTSAPIPVSINVSRPPVVPATDPSYTTPSGTSLTVAPTDGVLDGVTDPDGDPLRIALVDIPQNGDINISPEDGSFLYVPNPGFSGTETFTYTVTDGINTSEPIPVTIAVTAPTTGGNQPPTLPDATPTYGAPANQPFVVSPTEGVLQGVTDPEGDPLRIALVDVPQNGDINISAEDGSFTYVPTPGFAGTETFTYTVTDGTNTSAPIPVAIDVSRPPVISDTNPLYGTAVDTPLTVTPSEGVLDGVSDPDGDTLRIALVDVPQNGGLDISAEDGSFLYVPNPGFVGTETFSYTVTDGINTSEPIPVSIDVQGKDSNRLCDVFVNFDSSTIGDLPAGTVVTNQFSDVGLNISTPFNQFGAMIFDSANPTGEDPDLGSDTQGNILIISEDGDSSDPDDEMFGGTIRFEWDSLVNVESMGFLDIGQDGGTVDLFDVNDILIQSFAIPNLGDNSDQVVSFGVADVSRMDVNFANSGAVTNLMWESRGICDVAAGLPGNLGDC